VCVSRLALALSYHDYVDVAAVAAAVACHVLTFITRQQQQHTNIYLFIAKFATDHHLNKQQSMNAFLKNYSHENRPLT